MLTEETMQSKIRGLYLLAGISALIAMAANLLDVVLGFGSTEITAYGTKSALDWFTLFHEDGFNGLYTLGLFNIVYMSAMIPVYFALYVAHRRADGPSAALAMITAFIATAVYISNNAAIPMHALSVKYAAAVSEAQKAPLLAAGEAALARGEDFTPGSFIGLILGGIAAVTVSFVMRSGRIFGRMNAWAGIIGFTFLSVFTVLATFVPSLYWIAFYVFGMIGGLLALVWFALVGLKFFKLGRQAPRTESE